MRPPLHPLPPARGELRGAHGPRGQSPSDRESRDRRYCIGVDGTAGISGPCVLHYTLFPPPAVNFVERTAQGANRLQVVGATGQTNMHFTLQASTDLRNWTNVFIVTTNSTLNVIEFTDTASANPPRRFYRAVMNPWPRH